MLDGGFLVFWLLVLKVTEGVDDAEGCIGGAG